jgi:hypothetical protein
LLLVNARIARRLLAQPPRLCGADQACFGRRPGPLTDRAHAKNNVGQRAGRRSGYAGIGPDFPEWAVVNQAARHSRMPTASGGGEAGFYLPFCGYWHGQIFSRGAKIRSLRDFMELLLIRQVQNETWKILRYTRHQTLGIDRRFRESLELQVKAQKEQAARRGALAKELAQQTGRSETELARVLYLRGIVMSSVDDVDAILDREPTEIEHNKALEAGIVFQEQLDRLINSSLKRRNEAIEQLDFYRAGFGQRWREISDQILDAEATEIGEAKQIMAPTLTPTDEPSESVTA